MIVEKVVKGVKREKKNITSIYFSNAFETKVRQMVIYSLV